MSGPDKFSLAHAYRAGRTAVDTLEPNPYTEGTPNHYEWLRGYAQAAAEDQLLSQSDWDGHDDDELSDEEIRGLGIGRTTILD